MKCPNCNETLLMTHRNNIEIDYCPNCRGVWLDKGELDKLLEQAEKQFPNDNPNDQYRSHNAPDHHRNYSDRYQKPYKKKKSFLGDFFDFD